MKIEKTTGHMVEFEGRTYERCSADNWMVQVGESMEPAYFGGRDGLEAKFQASVGIDIGSLKTTLDGEEITIRGYLERLLTQLWWEKESFSAKRPLGDSGWESDIYIPLVEAGLVQGRIGEDRELEAVDHKAADALIATLIVDTFYAR